MGGCLQRIEWGIGSPGSGDSGGCQLSDTLLRNELQFSPLQEQQMLLTAEPYLCTPKNWHFCWYLRRYTERDKFLR